MTEEQILLFDRSITNHFRKQQASILNDDSQARMLATEVAWS